MRYYTIEYKQLVEATIDQIQKRIPVWAKQYYNNNVDEALKMLPEIIKADPTNGKYSEWLIKQWKNKTANFPADTEILAKNLEMFDKKKSKLVEKDLSKYTPESLAQALEQQLGLTKSEIKKAKRGELLLPPGAELVLESGPYQVVKITTPEASSKLCSRTKWCTANIDKAEEYLYGTEDAEAGPLYIVYKNGKRDVLIHYESDEFHDPKNDPIEEDYEIELMKLLFPVVKDQIIKSPGIAVDHANRVIGGEWPEAEKNILKDIHLALEYATRNNKKWPEFEKEVFSSKDAGAAYKYARDVLKKRWPAAEPIIIKNPWTAADYAIKVIKGEWPEAEPIILQTPHPAADYAVAIKGEWPEAEPIILQKRDAAYVYALGVKGEWPEAEEMFSKDPVVAYYYATKVLKRRFPMGEEMIKSSVHWKDYAKTFGIEGE